MINFLEAEKVKNGSSSVSRVFDPVLDDENANLLGKNFFKICKDFNITPKEQVIILGQKHLRTVKNWEKSKTIGQSWDVFNRVSQLIGIVKSLNVIYPRNPEVVNQWMHKPRKIFKNKSAIDIITENPLQSHAALYTVRRVLDCYRNGVLVELS